MSAGVLVLLVSLAASLFLAVRAMRGHGLGFEATARMVVAWILIIAIVAFVAGRLGA